MLILLPPSEGKNRPTRGKPLDLAGLADETLLPARRTVLQQLVAVCSGPVAEARQTLGIPATMDDLVETNSNLWSSPTAKAADIYSGVLYSALDLPSLQGVSLRRANRRIAIMSALFGLVRPTDRIPPYRLSAGVNLPGAGALARFWRQPLTEALESARPGLIIDMRSSPYAAMWSPTADTAVAVVTVKVWQRTAKGQRIAVSHHNKATKGSLARVLATAAATPRSASAVAEVAAAAGWDVELAGSRLDVYTPH